MLIQKKMAELSFKGRGELFCSVKETFALEILFVNASRAGSHILTCVSTRIAYFFRSRLASLVSALRCLCSSRESMDLDDPFPK